MDYDQFATSLWKQFVTAWNNPAPFLAAMLVGWFAIRSYYSSKFETRHANDKSTIEMLEKLLDRRSTDEAISIASASQQPENALARKSTTAPTKAARLAGPKEYVPDEHTPLYFVGMFADRTELQARKIFEGEIGKWMKITGPVAGVTPMDNGVLVAIPIVAMRMVFGHFDEGVAELERFNMGAVISFEGKIAAIRPLGVDLEQCILIS